MTIIAKVRWHPANICLFEVIDRNTRKSVKYVQSKQ